ncbi:MAG: hypothetical protein MJ245_06265 [Clostridia bacterium]|nr:hypothetical protein [Clostridia bacterium]
MKEEEKAYNVPLKDYLRNKVKKNTLCVLRKNGKDYCSFLNDDNTIKLIKELNDAVVVNAGNGGISIPAGFRDIECTFPCVFIDIR